MTAPVPPSDVTARSSVDWDELSGLDRINSIYQIGPNVVVLETTDSREVKISAWFDRRTGQYVADFEKRCTVSNGGTQMRVWAHTPAYPRCIAGDLVGCLEEAILEVDRMPVY
jgi:hypothetical protein